MGGDDLFAHKREFGGVEPKVGQGVSYVVEATEKGDAAKKYVRSSSEPFLEKLLAVWSWVMCANLNRMSRVREEESIPEMVMSDEGREVRHSFFPAFNHIMLRPSPLVWDH